jgi:hypothetical protein
MMRRIFLDPDSDSDDPEEADANTDPVYGLEDAQDITPDISYLDSPADTTPDPDPPTLDPVPLDSAQLNSDPILINSDSNVPIEHPIRNATDRSLSASSPSPDDITVPTANLSDHRESGESSSSGTSARLFSEQPSPVLPPAEPPPPSPRTQQRVTSEGDP